MINAKTKAIIKLNNGPAKTTDILARIDLLLKERGSSLSSKSSSPITQAPPNGKRLIVYCVSPFLNPTIFGPSPSENSVTLIPFNLATKKCPNS